MTKHTHIGAAELLAVTLALTGCGAAGTDDSVDSQEPELLQSLDEPCGPDEINAADLLGQIDGPYDSPFGLDKLSIDRLTLDAVYRDGEILCYPPVHAAPGTLQPELPAHLEIEIEVSFATAGGAFDENLAAVLSGSAGTAPTFLAAIAATELEGTYVPSLGRPDEVGLSFSGSFAGSETNGSVFEGRRISASVGESAPVGYWPMAVR